MATHTFFDAGMRDMEGDYLDVMEGSTRLWQLHTSNHMDDDRLYFVLPAAEEPDLDALRASVSHALGRGVADSIKGVTDESWLAHDWRWDRMAGKLRWLTEEAVGAGLAGGYDSGCEDVRACRDHADLCNKMRRAATFVDEQLEGEDGTKLTDEQIDQLASAFLDCCPEVDGTWYTFRVPDELIGEFYDAALGKVGVR